jgi:hypothetical protein
LPSRNFLGKFRSYLGKFSDFFSFNNNIVHYLRLEKNIKGILILAHAAILLLLKFIVSYMTNSKHIEFYFN